MEAEASRAPAFVMTWESGNRFRLKNTGDAPGTNLRVDFGNEAYREQKVLDFEEPALLGPEESFTFMMTSALGGMHRPDQVRVHCDELPEGQPVAVPVAR